MGSSLADGNFAASIEILNAGRDLKPEQIRFVMREILNGNADVESIKSFLLALKAKGETADEVGALVAEMYAHAAPINITERAVDTVGTGGDGAHTINISTTAAIIAAAAGARVVKHGNRAVSSKSGASDFLEALGVVPGLDGKGVERTVRELGIGFCFAPIFHPAMRFAAPARKELGVSTVFNILGPLANPAKPKAAAVGVANERMHLVMAQVLAAKGCDGFVFRGDDGLDEITIATTTTILSIGKDVVTSDRIDAKDFGLSNAPLSAIVGGDPAENARISLAILAGELGAPRDAVLLNASAAIAAFEGDLDSDVKQRLTAGLSRATKAVDSGAASALLKKWAALTSQISAS
ncbi:anthranilate phosphoribosyltransferase [Candidatus Planktophila versatilis]|uniref:Anthranilate phosphoribosyltransferase n=1 Tax=Candidatus Planktophila versatilis TaxID=1884905 RepID=A0ABM6MEJ1_9ACTN|nr:anthranilate phosphoribosyltransferase [Candidatus Planktophila versatilis]ASY17319.1 anthranilate phosphoribosyltransferase [Candidatus Planktophila versatilis]